jgi:hypothetical protein
VPVAVAVLVPLVIATRWRARPLAAAMVVLVALVLTLAGAARVARATMVVLRRMPRAPVVTVMVARRFLI